MQSIASYRESTVPTITGKEKAGTGNMSSEDRSTGHKVLLVTENYRLQSIIGYNVVPILTGKKPASNPVLTGGSLVTEFSRLQRKLLVTS